MKKITFIGLVFVALVLTAGCVTGPTPPSTPVACAFDTPWGSCIDDQQSDSALIGISWFQEFSATSWLNTSSGL